MAEFNVALYSDRSYQRTVEAPDATTAAATWASWYCQENAEYDLDECWVEQFPGVWQSFSIEIENRPHFRATEGSTDA